MVRKRRTSSSHLIVFDVVYILHATIFLLNNALPLLAFQCCFPIALHDKIALDFYSTAAPSDNPLVYFAPFAKSTTVLGFID